MKKVKNYPRTLALNFHCISSIVDYLLKRDEMIARQTAYIYLQTVHTAFQSLIFASSCVK